MATNNSTNQSSTGMQSLPSSGAIVGRTITSTSNQTSVTNGNGTAGNPTIGLAPIITLSTQPAFFARLSTNPVDVTGDGTAYTIICDTETFDQGNNYNNSTGVFTAPVAGNYLFMASVGVLNLLISHTQCNLTINSYVVSAGALFAIESADNNNSVQAQVILPLALNDTVSVVLTVSNGTKTVDVFGSNNTTWFCGALLC